MLFDKPTKTCLLVIALSAAVVSGVAAMSPAEKMDLFSEALEARDSGDFYRARDLLEQLVFEEPQDASLRSALDEVNRRITDLEEPADASEPMDFRQIEALMAEELQRQTKAISRAEQAAHESQRLIRQQQYDRALAILYTAQKGLPENVRTKSLQARLNALKADALYGQANAFFRRGNQSAAWESLTALAALEGHSVRFQEMKDAFQQNRSAPELMLASSRQTPAPVQQDYTASTAYDAARGSEAEMLVQQGREAFLLGKLDEAETLLSEALEADPQNVKASEYLTQIASMRRRISEWNRKELKETMLNEVNQSWRRPHLSAQAAALNEDLNDPGTLVEKLNGIVIPSVSYSGVELSRVVNSLTELAVRYDRSGSGIQGVNLVLLDPGGTNPQVNITLRNLSLKRILDFVVDSVGFQYEVEPDAVVIRPGEGGVGSNLETEFFPISRSTFIRMTGIGVGEQQQAVVDPFAPPGGAMENDLDEGVALRGFLQQAGVDFSGIAGSSLAYDGSSMIVTQSRRNLDRIRNILNRYDEVRQVEIEAKFLEVSQGDLEELGVQWNIGRRDGQEAYASGNRSLSGVFNRLVSGSSILIKEEGTTPYEELLFPPDLPGTVNIAADTGALANISGTVGEFDINAVVRALSQKSGSDLLSAPKVTVLSGDQALMTVAQEFRYPQAYSPIEAEVGSSSSGSSGSAGVAITSGTPEDFTTRNIGVELDVTPRVEEDDYSITLDLHPRVTEFDGFVEYGGPSIAIGSGRSVKVPSGFYQPILSVREVKTRVTVWDGATVVMGGLTREEVKEVHDKVPLLGDIPLLGRMFRSDGETSQKRNLLIFVTANLVSPGGSLKNQTVSGIRPGSVYQSDQLTTPAGTVERE